MTVLVAYGSTHGGTKGLAEMLADGLREEAMTVEVAPARSAPNPEQYEAVVVGGALYASRWHRDAKRFVTRHAKALRTRPTYLFSSGPLDDSAANGDLAPVKGVRALIERSGARAHITFGGTLSPDTKGVIASAMAKKSAGDWRDRAQVRAWAKRLASELRDEAASGA